MKRHIFMLSVHCIIVVIAGLVAYYTISLISITVAIIAELAIFAFRIRYFFSNAYDAVNIHKAEAEFARCLVSAEQAHYQKIGEMHETLSILRHDFKYHLKVIDELLQMGNTEKAEQYLKR